ncbi:MAG TPA: hypothetical protein VN661_01025 [Candidatus Acidoferrales bacterium]|nr:hypothetical protein [Candidatus Acidoferrales bacterium]
MPVWLDVFIVVISIAIIVQLFVLLAIVASFRVAIAKVLKLAEDYQGKLDPILFRTGRILEISEEHIATIMTDAAEVTRVARSQAQKVDRVFTDAVERLRLQVMRADHILTGALEVIDEAGSKFRRTLWAPVQQASAVLRGLKASLDFIRGQQQRNDSQAATQDEELFI